MSDFAVESVEAAALYDLRRRVLRGERPVAFQLTLRTTTRPPHSTSRDVLIGRVVASASFFLASAPIRPELVSYQLRFMAVDDDVQGRGYGTLVLDAATAALRDLGAEQLWANARDVALGFYLATGWTPVEGTENVSPLSNLPHTEHRKVDSRRVR